MTILYGFETITINNLFNNYSSEKFDEIKEIFEMHNRFDVISFEFKEIVLKINMLPATDLRFADDTEFMKKLETEPEDFDNIKTYISAVLRNEVLSAYDIFFKDRHLVSEDESGFAYFRKDKKWFYIDYDLFKNELKEMYVEIYTFLEIGGISFYLETDKSITIMTKRNGYDELWSDTFSMTVPRKERMIELSSLKQFEK